MQTDTFDNCDLKIQEVRQPSRLIKDPSRMQLFIRGRRLLIGWIKSKMQSR